MPLLKGTDDRHSHQEVEEQVKYYAPRRQKAPPPGLRPASLAEPQGHAVEHLADLAPMVQILDAHVPQTVGQLAEILKLLDTQRFVEQVIDVPQISQDLISQRLGDRVLRHPQMVEQLVEVPTVLSLALLQQQIAEQIVDNPVPRGRGRRRQSFLSGQNSTASVAE